MARTLVKIEEQPSTGRRLERLPSVTPLEVPAGPPPSMGVGDAIFEEGVDPTIKSAAERGVIFDRPAPSGHFAASLAYDQERARRAYQASLSADATNPIDVRINADGDFEYFSPDDNRYALVSPPGTVIPEAFGGPAIALGTEAATDAFIVLPAAMGSGVGAPIVAWSGAAGAATIGDIVRMSLGKALGVNEDVSFEEIAQKAALQSGMPAALMGPATAIARKVYRYTTGQSTVDDFISNTGLSVDEAIKIQDQFNARAQGADLRFSLAQGSGNEDLMAIEGVFKKSGETMARFRSLSERQNQAFRTFADVINRPYQHRQELDQITQSVREAGNTALQRPRIMEDRAVDTKRLELEEVTSSLRSRSPESLAAPVRAHAAAERDAFIAWKNEAVDQLETIAGSDNFVDIPNFRRTINTLNSRSKRVLLPELQQQIGTPPDGRHTFGSAWDTLSELKRRRRERAEGRLLTEGPDVAKLDKMISALERDLRTSMDGKDPRLRDIYDQFRGAYAREKRRLDQGAVFRIMQTQSGQPDDFRIQSDRRVFDTLLPRGGDGVELFNLVRESPQAMQSVREALKGAYDAATGVETTGRINLNAHRKFMRDHSKQMRKFFTPDEMKIIERGRGIEQALAAREAKQAVNLKRINESFEAKLEDLNPSGLTRLITDRNNPTDVKRLRDILESTPDVLRGVQSQYVKNMMRAIRGPRTPGLQRTFSSNKLDDFLHGEGLEGGQLQNIRILMGKKYADDLTVLNNALKVAQKRAENTKFSNAAFNVPGNTVLNSLARAYVGIFTPAGRGITAFTKIRAKISQRAMTDAMAHPDDLRLLIQNARMSPRSKRGRDILAAFGASALMDFWPNETVPEF